MYIDTYSYAKARDWLSVLVQTRARMYIPRSISYRHPRTGAILTAACETSILMSALCAPYSTKYTSVCCELLNRQVALTIGGSSEDSSLRAGETEGGDGGNNEYDDVRDDAADDPAATTSGRRDGRSPESGERARRHGKSLGE